MIGTRSVAVGGRLTEMSKKDRKATIAAVYGEPTLKVGYLTKTGRYRWLPFAFYLSRTFFGEKLVVVSEVTFSSTVYMIHSPS